MDVARSKFGGRPPSRWKPPPALAVAMCIGVAIALLLAFLAVIVIIRKICKRLDLRQQTFIGRRFSSKRQRNYTTRRARTSKSLNIVDRTARRHRSSLYRNLGVARSRSMHIRSAPRPFYDQHSQLKGHMESIGRGRRRSSCSSYRSNCTNHSTYRSCATTASLSDASSQTGRNKQAYADEIV